MFEDKRYTTFKAVESQVIEWWRHLDNIAQKDKVEGFILIETESLKAVFKTIISEVEKVFSERDKITSPEIEIQNVMDLGSQLLSRVLRFSNIKSGRRSWLSVMVDGEGPDEKTVDLKKQSKEFLPVWKRGAIRVGQGVHDRKPAISDTNWLHELAGDDDESENSDVPVWLR